MHTSPIDRGVLYFHAPNPAVPDLLDRRLYGIRVENQNLHLIRAKVNNYHFQEATTGIQLNQIVRMHVKNEFLSVTPGEDWQWKRRVYINDINRYVKLNKWWFFQFCFDFLKA